MRSQTVGKKIALTSLLLLPFMIALGAVAFTSMSRMETATQSVVSDALPGVYQMGRAETVGKDIRAEMLKHISSDKQEEMAQVRQNRSGV